MHGTIRHRRLHGKCSMARMCNLTVPCTIANFFYNLRARALILKNMTRPLSGILYGDFLYHSEEWIRPGSRTSSTSTRRHRSVYTHMNPLEFVGRFISYVTYGRWYARWYSSETARQVPRNLAKFHQLTNCCFGTQIWEIWIRDSPAARQYLSTRQVGPSSTV